MADHLCLSCKWGQRDALAYKDVNMPQSLCQQPEPAPEVKLPHYARLCRFTMHPGAAESYLSDCTGYEED